MADTDLVALASSDDLSALENAWGQEVSEPGDVDVYTNVIATLCERDLPGKALSLAGDMIDALVAKDRTRDARRMAAVIVANRVHNDKLAHRHYELIEGQDGKESWFSQICDLANLSATNITAPALTDYEKFRQFTVGHVLYHRAGWGEGLVTEFRAETGEIVIDFVSGREREMPLQAAIESLQTLPADDLRSMRILRKEELERITKEEPSVLIRKAAKIFRGKITSTKVKELLTPSIIPAKKWNTFWKKAKATAAHDPWLQVEGSTTRPVFVLRKKPISLGEEATREIQYADDLADGIGICRKYLDRSHDANAISTILEIAQALIESALTKTSDPETAPKPAHLLDGILLLAEHKIATSVTPEEELKILLYEDGKFQPENLNKLTTAASREHAISILPGALGENWAQACVDDLHRFPADVVEVVVQKVAEAGQAELLLSLWEKIAPYPRQHPMMTYMMGCLFADGVFDGQENAPDKVTVGRVLMHLVRTLNADRKGDAQKGRLLTRLVSLLTGRREYLKSVLADIGKEDLASYFGITERGGNDFPQEIANLVLRTVAKKYPQLTAKPDKPFWESDFNFVTNEGLNRYREEYRELVEEKIPANSKAIGVAASHGDISENSEWDAAMEEQRNLTNRATVMDEELQLAKLIDGQILPDDTVAPGTRVTFTDLTDGEERTILLLGPWDVTNDDILNYKAPLGQALLGAKPGQVAHLTVAGSDHELRVDHVEKI
ncbi:MAG: GreA/GreB family elongation factor [Planctomycetota bacterium]|nr:GreA/GreB family elongation factor [Planctomycetota bacterium]